jgi:hypothetical protein
MSPDNWAERLVSVLVDARAASGGGEHFDDAHPPAQFGRLEWGVGCGAGTGGQQCPRQRVFALGDRDHREHAVGGGDHDVVALAHPDQQRVDLDGLHRVAVGVGDRHRVPGQCNPERGVSTGVDEPDPNALCGFGGERGRCCRDASVDQVVGVVDVPGVPAEQVAVPDATHHRHAAHAGHAAHT